MKDIFFSRKFAALALDAIIGCILLFALFCSPTAVRAQEVVIDSTPRYTSWLELVGGNAPVDRRGERLFEFYATSNFTESRDSLVALHLVRRVYALADRIVLDPVMDMEATGSTFWVNSWRDVKGGKVALGIGWIASWLVIDGENQLRLDFFDSDGGVVTLYAYEFYRDRP